MQLELPEKSDLHLAWFNFLWEEWLAVTKDISNLWDLHAIEEKSANIVEEGKTIKDQYDNPKTASPGSPTDHLSPFHLDIQTLLVKFNREQKRSLQKGREKNIRSEISSAIKLFLGLEQARQKPLQIESDALFTIMRTPFSSLFSFYAHKAENEISKITRFDPQFYEVVRHILFTYTEAHIRHRDLDLPTIPQKTLSAWLHYAWAIQIAENSIPDLASGNLSPLQDEAFNLISDILAQSEAEQDADSPPFHKIPTPGSSAMMLFFFKWFTTKIPHELSEIQQGIKIMKKAAPNIDPDTLTNSVYLFKKIIRTYQTNRPSLSISDHQDILNLKTETTLIAHANEATTYLILDFFNLLQAFFVKIDLLWDKTNMHAPDSLHFEEIQQLVREAKEITLAHINKLPVRFQKTVRLHIELSVAFHVQDYAQVDHLYGKLMKDSSVPVPIVIDLVSKWNYLKARIARIDRPMKITDEIYQLAQELRALELRAERQSNSERHQSFLNSLGKTAALTTRFLLAKQAGTKQRALQKMESTPDITDKHWQIFHLRQLL